MNQFPLLVILIAIAIAWNVCVYKRIWYPIRDTLNKSKYVQMDILNANITWLKCLAAPIHAILCVYTIHTYDMTYLIILSHSSTLTHTHIHITIQKHTWYGCRGDTKYIYSIIRTQFHSHTITIHSAGLFETAWAVVSSSIAKRKWILNSPSCLWRHRERIDT